ncbi:MAG TPA: DUF4125 family protein [Clostridiales bacterium]|nr:DUF4125 family protein [Clostridiales bacterium]
MSDKLKAILDIEWEMFSTTQNEGGKASCQEDREQFALMRTAQFTVWDENSLESYLEDLKSAEASGRNLIAEKYAYMMESTAPEEYERIRYLLPPVTAEKEALVASLVRQTVEWAEEFQRKYPKLASLGRPIHRSCDSPWLTSAETYHRGELLTYGERTLRLLDKLYRENAAQGSNLYEAVIEETVLLTGYKSLEEAENSIN